MTTPQAYASLDGTHWYQEPAIKVSPNGFIHLLFKEIWEVAKDKNGDPFHHMRIMYAGRRWETLASDEPLDVSVNQGMRVWGPQWVGTYDGKAWGVFRDRRENAYLLGMSELDSRILKSRVEWPEKPDENGIRYRLFALSDSLLVQLWSITVDGKARIGISVDPIASPGSRESVESERLIPQISITTAWSLLVRQDRTLVLAANESRKGATPGDGELHLYVQRRDREEFHETERVDSAFSWVRSVRLLGLVESYLTEVWAPPVLCETKRGVCVSWIGVGKDGSFNLLCRNYDSGLDQLGPTQVIASGELGTLALHSTASDPEGGVHFSWLHRNSDEKWQVYYARSRDGGFTVEPAECIGGLPFEMSRHPGERRSWGMTVDAHFAYVAWVATEVQSSKVMVARVQHSK